MLSSKLGLNTKVYHRHQKKPILGPKVPNRKKYKTSNLFTNVNCILDDVEVRVRGQIQKIQTYN